MRLIQSTMEVALTREDIELAVQAYLNTYFRDMLGKSVDGYVVQSITINKEAKYLIRAEISHNEKPKKE
jgi:hypothetical protein